MVNVLRFPRLTFALAALGVSGAAQWIVASPSFAAHPGPLSLAVLTDLTLTVSALYYFLVVRRGAGSALMLIPIALLGFLRARMFLPQEQLERLPALEFVFVGLEILLLVFAVSKVVSLRREYRRANLREPEFADAFPRAMRRAFGESVLVEGFITELLTLYFAAFARHSGHPLPEGTVAFSGHRRAGWSGVAFGIGMVMGVEAVAVHFLVQRWSAPAAWVLSALSAYGFLWLIGDLRALSLRPTLLGRHTLSLRIGLRWHAEVPLELIRKVRELTKDDVKHPGYRRVTVLGSPQWVIELHRPVGLRSPWRRREATLLGVSMDDAGFTPLLQRYVSDLNLSRPHPLTD